MPRGGYHPNAERWGRRSGWNSSGTTKTVRVPEVLVEKILELAHKLDSGGNIAFDTKSIDSHDGKNNDKTFSNNVYEQKIDTLENEVERLRSQVAALEAELEEQKGENNFQEDRWKLTEKRNNGLAKRIQEVNQLNEVLSKRLEQCEQQEQQLDQQLDLEQQQESFLASLRMGRQAPDYKQAKRWISRFIAFLEPKQL